MSDLPCRKEVTKGLWIILNSLKLNLPLCGMPLASVVDDVRDPP